MHTTILANFDERLIALRAEFDEALEERRDPDYCRSISRSIMDLVREREGYLLGIREAIELADSIEFPTVSLMLRDLIKEAPVA